MHIGIVMWTLCLTKGGGERAAANIANMLQSRGHRVTVIYHWIEDDVPISMYQLSDGIKHLPLNLAALRNCCSSDPIVIKTREQIHNAGFDVLAVLAGGRKFMIFPYLLLGTGIPLLFSVRLALKGIFTLMHPDEYFACMAAADTIHILNNCDYNVYPSFLHNRIKYIANPCKTQIYYNQQKSNPPFFLLAVGRFEEKHKQFSFLIAAFTQLAKDFPNWRLVLCGNGKSRKDYERQVSKSGVESQIFMPGVLEDDELKYWYERSHLFCIPSAYEGLPQVLLEAASYGLPAVGFAICPGVNEIIVSGENGLLADEMSIEGLACQLATLMRDDTLRIQFGERSRELCTRYEPQLIYDMWENILQETALCRNKTRLNQLNMPYDAESCYSAVLLGIILRPAPFNRYDSNLLDDLRIKILKEKKQNIKIKNKFINMRISSLKYAEQLKLTLNEHNILHKQLLKTQKILLATSSLLQNEQNKQHVNLSIFLKQIVTLLARLPFIHRCFAGVWLFADRDFKADDNAEHLYRWIVRNHPERNILFALCQDSPDWKRLKQEGFHLINLSSLWYAFAWLHCDWLISSNRTGYITKPGWGRRYAGIVHHRFCFLQHGITKDFQPGLNIPHADMLITAARAEYRAFVDDPRYVYTEREVRLTGFPRHDALLRKAEAIPEPRTVLIMPTWRKNLVDALIPRTGRYPYSRRFVQSEYFYNWQAVLCSPTLQDAAKRCGYTIRFFPHPYIRQQLRDFDLSGVDCPPDAGGSIQDVLADTALLITDYSSTAMEMALLHRPVLYFQFDRESFFTQDHSYSKGYFDYERDGFGPVLQTVEALCAQAAACMEEGCRMDAVHRERAETFFAFRDQDNCRRVYEALCGYCEPSLPIDSLPKE